MAEVTTQPLPITKTGAAESDWRENCVQPVKDTRVQTEVIHFSYLSSD